MNIQVDLLLLLQPPAKLVSLLSKHCNPMCHLFGIKSVSTGSLPFRVTSQYCSFLVLFFLVFAFLGNKTQLFFLGLVLSGLCLSGSQATIVLSWSCSFWSLSFWVTSHYCSFLVLFFLVFAFLGHKHHDPFRVFVFPSLSFPVPFPFPFPFPCFSFSFPIPFYPPPSARFFVQSCTL